MPWVGLHWVIVAFPDRTHFLITGLVTFALMSLLHQCYEKFFDFFLSAESLLVIIVILYEIFIFLTLC